MAYIATVDFIDLEDGSRLYKQGAPWPREGYKPTKKRVKALSTHENAAGFPLIQCTDETPDGDDKGGEADA